MNKLKEIIVSSSCQTKQWRNSQEWYNSGKSNECEKYQIRQLEKVIKPRFEFNNIPFERDTQNTYRLQLSNGRMFIGKNKPENICKYEVSESFDYVFIYNKHKKHKFFINFKFIVDNGGAQDRSFQCVYFFIQAQNKFMENYENTEDSDFVHFINILDGDYCAKHIGEIKHLSRKNIFIGDMEAFKYMWEHT